MQGGEKRESRRQRKNIDFLIKGEGIINQSKLVLIIVVRGIINASSHSIQSIIDTHPFRPMVDVSMQLSTRSSRLGELDESPFPSINAHSVIVIKL